MIDGKKGVVLFVDDEQSVRMALKRELEVDDDIEVIGAASGSEGLEILASAEVAVVISDQRMPEMSGAEFLRQARELCPDVFRIMLTGFSDLKAVTDTINGGEINRFHFKPWNSHEMLQDVRHGIERYELIQEKRKLQEQKIDAERVRVLVETAGAAAHEINQPLTVIVGVADLMAMVMKPDDPQLKRIDSIRDATVKIGQILMQMREARRYVTKPYCKGQDIVDFGAASSDSKKG